MLLKKYKIIKKVWFVRSKTLNKQCSGNCLLHIDGHKTCITFVTSSSDSDPEITMEDICFIANKHMADDYIPLEYAIRKI